MLGALHLDTFQLDVRLGAQLLGDLLGVLPCLLNHLLRLGLGFFQRLGVLGVGLGHLLFRLRVFGELGADGLLPIRHQLADRWNGMLPGDEDEDREADELPDKRRHGATAPALLLPEPYGWSRRPRARDWPESPPGSRRTTGVRRRFPELAGTAPRWPAAVSPLLPHWLGPVPLRRSCVPPRGPAPGWPSPHGAPQPSPSDSRPRRQPAARLPAAWPRPAWGVCFRAS